MEFATPEKDVFRQTVHLPTNHYFLAFEEKTTFFVIPKWFNTLILQCNPGWSQTVRGTFDAYAILKRISHRYVKKANYPKG